MRIALKLAYLGTEYYGFQTQHGVPTIEGKILKALKELGAIRTPSKARYSAAGRTDRGVHALGQVITFDSENPDASAPRALNSKLTHIWAYAMAEVNNDFNARKSALEREYRYMQWGEGLDFDKIKDAASIFPGSHDFRNFATPELGKSTACDIRMITVQKNGEWIYLDISSNRFLWHMVRKIATALKLIGKGEKDRDWLERMLDCSISDRLEPQDPHGLILMDVRYPDIKWIIDRYARNRVHEEMHELFISHEISAKMLKEMENGMRQ